MTLLCLDLDGTLEDSRNDMVASVRRVRALLGLPVRADAAVRSWVNKGMDQLYLACFDDYLQGNLGRMEEVRKRYEIDYYDHVADETTLYPGIAASLEQLVRLGQLACVTNKPERISWRLLDVLGVRKFFSTVIGGDTCPKTKPDPLVLEAAARRCGFDHAKGHTFMIGDTAADLAMGKAFGATTIWCAWGYVDKPGDEQPDVVAKAPEQLPEIVGTVLRTVAGKP